MGIADHVRLTISAENVGVIRAGFGVPLILSHNAAWAVDRVRFYASITEVAVDFPTTSSPEYIAAQACFAQSPKPARIAIGRAALKPTQRYQLDVVAVRNSYTYTAYVKGQGVTDTTVTFASDASATNDEIVAGLLAAFNAVVGKNFTATETGSVGTKDLLVTGDAAGNWFSIEVANVADLKIAQTHADPGVATDLAAIVLADDTWYALYTFYNSNAYVLAAAAWIETQKKIYLFDVNETDAITTTVGNSDTIDDIKTATYARTSGWYHPSPANMIALRLLARCLPLEPGAVNFKFKTLAGGLPVSGLSSTHKTNLRARNGNTYTTIAGLNISWDGKTGDDYIDSIRNIDWQDDDMTKSIFEVLAAEDIVAMTPGGISKLEAAMRGSVERAMAKEIGVRGTEAFEVPESADIPAADRLARILAGMKFSYDLANAVNEVEMNGTLSR